MEMHLKMSHWQVKFVILLSPWYADPSGVKTWKFQDSWVNTIAANDLAPNVTKPSAAISLTLWPLGNLNEILGT